MNVCSFACHVCGNLLKRAWESDRRAHFATRTHVQCALARGLQTHVNCGAKRSPGVALVVAARSYTSCTLRVSLCIGCGMLEKADDPEFALTLAHSKIRVLKQNAKQNLDGTDDYEDVHSKRVEVVKRGTKRALLLDALAWVAHEELSEQDEKDKEGQQQQCERRKYCRFAGADDDIMHGDRAWQFMLDIVALLPIHVELHDERESLANFKRAVMESQLGLMSSVDWYFVLKHVARLGDVERLESFIAHCSASLSVRFDIHHKGHYHLLYCAAKNRHGIAHVLAQHCGCARCAERVEKMQKWSEIGKLCSSSHPQA